MTSITRQPRLPAAPQCPAPLRAHVRSCPGREAASGPPAAHPGAGEPAGGPPDRAGPAPDDGRNDIRRVAQRRQRHKDSLHGEPRRRRAPPRWPACFPTPPGRAQRQQAHVARRSGAVTAASSCWRPMRGAAGVGTGDAVGCAAVSVQASPQGSSRRPASRQLAPLKRRGSRAAAKRPTPARGPRQTVQTGAAPPSGPPRQQK